MKATLKVEKLLGIKSFEDRESVSQADTMFIDWTNVKIKDSSILRDGKYYAITYDVMEQSLLVYHTPEAYSTTYLGLTNE